MIYINQHGSTVMKRKSAIVLSVLTVFILAFSFVGCNKKADLKKRAYTRWGVVIPASATEVFNYYSGGIDTGSFGVFETERDDIEFEMQPVDEAYKNRFLRTFGVYSKKTDIRINWEHELLGFYKSDRNETLFCVFDADENLLYVMDTDI